MAFPTQSALLASASSQVFTASSSASLNASTGLTCEGWIKFTTVPTSGEMGLLAKWTSGNNAQSSYEFDLQFAAGPTVTMRLLLSDGAAGQSASVTWSAAPSTGTWYHVAATWSGTSVKFFVDGTQMGATQTVSSFTMNSSTVGARLGAEFVGGSFFNGRMGLWRMWSADKSASISTNKCLVLGSTTSLGAEWTLDNVLTDNSGNSNTLTNVNSITFAADVTNACPVTPAGNAFFMGANF